ncbi:MAG: arginine--tRNA ligase, partial [bacterium]
MRAEDYLKKQILKVLDLKGLASGEKLDIVLEKPKSEEHGDLATNIAMTLAARLRRRPREIAEEILKAL